MSSIVPFSFESSTVRTIIIDDEVWWVAKDAASALGYLDPKSAIKQHCKGVAFHHPLQTPGGIQQVRLINEADLMRLIVNSQLPSAEKFERWVFEDVLPSIRKTGGYRVEPALVSSDRPAKVFPEYFRIAKLIGLDKNAAAISANQATFKKTGENVLALMGIEHLETEQPWFTPTELGQRIDVNGRRFNLLLLECGLQTKEGDHWLPTDSAKGMYRFFDTGKRHGDGTAVQQLKWSGDVLGKINREAA